MGHGKVMPPHTRDPQVIETYLMHMCEKLAARLRHQVFTRNIFLLACAVMILAGWVLWAKRYSQRKDGREIFQLGAFLLAQHWQGEPVCQIQVTALRSERAWIAIRFFC